MLHCETIQPQLSLAPCWGVLPDLGFGPQDEPDRFQRAPRNDLNPWPRPAEMVAAWQWYFQALLFASHFVSALDTQIGTTSFVFPDNC